MDRNVNQFDFDRNINFNNARDENERFERHMTVFRMYTAWNGIRVSWNSNSKNQQQLIIINFWVIFAMAFYLLRS